MVSAEVDGAEVGVANTRSIVEAWASRAVGKWVGDVGRTMRLWELSSCARIRPERLGRLRPRVGRGH